jgi:outer membrane protein assembly factor BamB
MFAHQSLAALGAVIVFMGSPPLARAQELPSADTAWRYQAQSDIALLRLCPTTELLLATDKAVVALDAGTGNVLWQLDGLPSFMEGLFWGGCDAATGLSYRKDKLAAFDLASGRRQWDASVLPAFQEIRGYFALGRKDLLLLFLRTAASDHSLVAVQLSTGARRWQRDDLFAQSPRFAGRRGVSDVSEYQVVITDSDTSLILYLSPDGPVRLDARSGATLWKGDALAGPRVPSLDEYAAMTAVDSVLVIPRDDGLIALDARDGHRLWENATLLPAHASRLVTLKPGLLVRAGRSYVTVLDPATGTPRWKRPLTVETDGVAYQIVDERYYVVTHDRLLAVDLATGDTTALATLAFDDGEHAQDVFAVDDGLLVVSRENLFRIDFRGAIRYHRFYKAPGASFLESLGGALTLNLGVFGARFGAAEFRSDYAYFLTNAADSSGRTGNSVVRVALKDGGEAGRIWFRERAPNFRADPARDQLLVFRDKKTLVAVRFPGAVSAATHTPP